MALRCGDHAAERHRTGRASRRWSLVCLLLPLNGLGHGDADYCGHPLSDAQVGQRLLQAVAQRSERGAGAGELRSQTPQESASIYVDSQSNRSGDSSPKVAADHQPEPVEYGEVWHHRATAALLELRGRVLDVRSKGSGALGMVLVAVCIALAFCGLAAFAMAFQMALGAQHQQHRFVDHSDGLPRPEPPSGAHSPRSFGPSKVGFGKQSFPLRGAYSQKSLPMAEPLSPVQSAPASRTPSETAMSSGPLSTRALQALCPGLVVPRENECLLAVPTLATIGIPDRCRRTSFDVRDLQGKAVIGVEVAVPEWRTVNGHGASAVEQMTIILRQAGAAGTTSPRGGPSGMALAMARAVLEPNGQRVVLVFSAGRDQFGRIVQAAGEGMAFRYESNRSRSLFFEGDHARYETRVFAPESVDQVLASTDLHNMPFDNGGAYYRLRVCQGADVGIMLIGLLAIEIIRTL